MNRRLKGWLLSLYPRRWRDRYGPEVSSLTDELIDAGETTPTRAGFDLTLSAVTERGRALGERWRALGRRRVLALATAFAMLLVLGFALSGHQVMRASSAMTVDCKANFISGHGQPFTHVHGQPFPKLHGQPSTKVNGQAFTKMRGQAQANVVGRLVQVRTWALGQGKREQVVVEGVGFCGPAGFGCPAQVPVPPNLRVVQGPKPGGLRVSTTLKPPGKQWTINAPAMPPCGMSVHARGSRVKVYTKPAPPQAPVKKQVQSKKKK
jgi:hypothetical protein